MRIGFIHPDLGIGGAERLVVDAAVGLQKLGHQVEVFTSYHEDGPTGRSFDETRDGTLSVHVLGDSIIPKSFGGRFTIICAIMRQIHLTWGLLISILAYRIGSMIPEKISPFIPKNTPFLNSSDWSIRRQTEPFDLFFVDQLSASVPILRWVGGTRVLFYCHFPDVLLSPTRTTSTSLIRKLYRVPFDLIEEFTTGESDLILVNSEFTKGMFRRTFPGLERRMEPRVVYPGIEPSAFGPGEGLKEDEWLSDLKPTFLSINRFEKKKNAELAIRAFGSVLESHKEAHLIIAGGFDSKLSENVHTLQKLVKVAKELSIPHAIYSSNPIALPDLDIISSPPSFLPSLLFLLNISSAQKKSLLSNKSIIALLYTPSFEHLGIVPLEGMASGLPVLATDTGGPSETIIDQGLNGYLTTGLLRAPLPNIWAEGMKDLIELDGDKRREIGMRGRRRVEKLYSTGFMSQELDAACRECVLKSNPIRLESNFLQLLIALALGLACTIFGLTAYNL